MTNIEVLEFEFLLPVLLYFYCTKKLIYTNIQKFGELVFFNLEMNTSIQQGHVKISHSNVM